MTAPAIRRHSSDDMDGLGELAGVFEPVAVVIRPDGSIDAYGDIAVVDQRRRHRPAVSYSESGGTPACAVCNQDWPCETWRREHL